MKTKSSKSSAGKSLKPYKGPHLTPKQKAARDYAEARKARREARTARAKHEWARAARDSARAARDVARARAALSGVASAGGAGGWILGGNDRYDNCAAAAVANSLLAATGHRVTSQDVLDLHRAVTGGYGTAASITATLNALVSHGIGGLHPASCQVLAGDEPLTGPLVVELALEDAQRRQDVWDWEPSRPWGIHAAALDGGAVITWGRPVPVTAGFLACQVTGAWQIRWE